MVSTVGHPFPVETIGSKTPERRNLSRREKQDKTVAFHMFATEQEIEPPYFKPSVCVGETGITRKFDVSPVVCRSQKNWDLMYGKNI